MKNHSFCACLFGIGIWNRRFSLSDVDQFFLIPTVIIGLVVCLITLFLFSQKRHKDGNPLLWINLFIILTAFVTAVSRINFSLSQALVSRYHINSAVIIVSTILLSREHLDIQSLFKTSFAKTYFKLLPILLVLYMILTFPMLYYFSYKVYYPIRNGGIIFPTKEYAADILDKARSNGVFGI